MHPPEAPVLDWVEEWIIVLPSFEDGSRWELLCTTVFLTWFADDGDIENWLNPMTGENDNSRAMIVRVKITMATDVEVVLITRRR